MTFNRSVRRAAAAALGAGAVLLSVAGPAAADPPPNCTTADMTGIMSGVSAAMSSYLWTHPDVNAFFTGLQGLPKAQVASQTQQYLDANPWVRSDLDGIRQPSTDFRARCGLIQRPLVPGL
ncbi:hemophore-related protein [Mycolicibacterium sp. BK556]|uniref:heme-binding protein n=1 Tax=Mycobacteriaceae TaxID=1762 RepID=UPI0010608EC7|nr:MULTISPECIES: heme-binding protein [Mycobacteriaceae]MBB3604022.1 hemophore-related protein [Mycolicibacterium sp. BK556]MBB3634218.1 hemophore-related protein [Mycolicibacterium sp. BK607]MBB3751798.1 hemophore-related protein [Mycolicibacterium sp. BK634]TDO12315.1 hemophore-related protein [Mycobacterium sp. BK086]